MSKIKRVREIKIEVEKVRVITNLKKIKIHCQLCEQNTEFIKLFQAEQIFQLSEENIQKLAKQNLVHLLTESNGELLVCLNSLLDAKENS